MSVGQENEEASLPFVSVLMIDDHVGLCSALKRLLAIDGFDVTAVHDVAPGIERADHRMTSGVLRFNEIQRLRPDLSPRILTAQLRELEEERSDRAQGLPNRAAENGILPFQSRRIAQATN